MDILSIVNNFPPEVWQMLLAGVIASPIIQGVKKWLDLKSHWVEALIAGIAILASLAVYALNAVPLVQNYPLAIALQAGLLRFGATPFYYIFIKGIWGALMAKQVAKGMALEEQLKSAVLPEGGLPVTPLMVGNDVTPNDGTFAL